MSILTQIQSQLNQLTERFNQLLEESKETEDFTEQSPIDPTSWVRLSKDGASFKSTVDNFASIAGDNIRRERAITFSGLDPVPATELGKAAAAINALSQFEIGANEIYEFYRMFSGVFVEVGGSSITGTYRQYYKLKNTGKGTYGNGGDITVTTSMLSKGRAVISSSPTYELGNIGTDEVWEYVNNNGPYAVSGTTIFTATQDGNEKVWLFQGNDGLYGDGEEPTNTTNFLDITAEEEIISPDVDLPIKIIPDNPYTLTPEDLNRPLIFTSNNQVVNIQTTLVELAAEAGLTLYDFIAHFQGTGTHTINHPQDGQWTGSQGTLVKGLCVDISGDSLWVIKEWLNNSVIANSHVQNTDTILDEGGANEITAEEIKTHVESTANPHQTDLQKAYDQTALTEDSLEKVIGVDDEGNVIEQKAISATILSQHTESQTTGDTGTNLLQPDFGANIFTVDDMQEGSVYEGSLLLEIDNNSGSGTENPVTLFGIELFKFATAIPEIKGKLNFKITFYNQSFNDVDYKISFDFISSGLMYFGTKTDTIDNTVSADIEFTVGGDVADIIKVNAPILQRC